MKYFSVVCEVWVKPLFRKARPKLFTETWAADDYNDLLLQLRADKINKRWQLKEWHELSVERVENRRKVSR